MRPPKNRPASNTQVLHLRPAVASSLSLQHAFNFLRQGQGERAMPLLEKLLQNDPQNFDALHLLGQLRLQRREAAQALQCLEKARALKPPAAALLNNLGIALRLLGRASEALDCYAQALRQAPAHPDALANITALLERLGQPQEAAHYRQKAAQAGGPVSG